MSKFTVSTSGGGALVVKANRPSTAAQKYASGKQLARGTVITVQNQAARRWSYQVTCGGSVKRVRSLEG